MIYGIACCNILTTIHFDHILLVGFYCYLDFFLFYFLKKKKRKTLGICPFIKYPLDKFSDNYKANNDFLYILLYSNLAIEYKQTNYSFWSNFLELLICGRCFNMLQSHHHRVKKKILFVEYWENWEIDVNRTAKKSEAVTPQSKIKKILWVMASPNLNKLK